MTYPASFREVTAIVAVRVRVGVSIKVRFKDMDRLFLGIG
jgi:hypothetical protein